MSKAFVIGVEPILCSGYYAVYWDLILSPTPPTTQVGAVGNSGQRSVFNDSLADPFKAESQGYPLLLSFHLYAVRSWSLKDIRTPPP